MKKALIVFTLLFPLYMSAQHTIVTRTGEKITGEVVSIKDGVLSFNEKGTVKTFKIGDLNSIHFNETAPSATTAGTKGVSYVMNGRKMTKQPTVNNLTEKKGIVVVEITINKYGAVVKAEPGAEGTTTTDQYLLTKAKQAAESTAFDSQPTSPLEQKGTITITF